MQEDAELHAHPLRQSYPEAWLLVCAAPAV